MKWLTIYKDKKIWNLVKLTNRLFSVILYSMRELIKSQNGVSIYKDGDKLIMYIEEQKILEMNKEFKSILDKSYDNLVKIRNKNSGETE